MRCEEARDLLSAYYDGELPPAKADAVAAHAAECLTCAQDLATFRKLSSLTEQLEHPPAPSGVWERLEEQLSAGAGTTEPMDKPTAVGSGARKMGTRRLRLSWKMAALSASVLTMVAVAWAMIAGMLRDNHDEHRDLATHFGQFLDEFQNDPEGAEQALVTNYHGRTVTLDEAVQELRYRPVIAAGVPPEYSLVRAYLLEMPCCKCLQVILVRTKGGMLAVFEHDDDQPIWFGSRPAITARCHGTETQLVQLNGELAATWKNHQRYVTLVGAKDVEEVSRLVAFVGAQTR